MAAIDDLFRRVATDLGLPAGGVGAVLRLFEEGATVPFIARYRKEASGDLDEMQIRAIQERHGYLVELEARRETVLRTISEQGKLTPELEAAIRGCATRAALEDLYLPYRPKRRTRASIARERGLEPLARRILEQPASGDPRAEASAFVDAEKGVADVDAALQGARDIAAESVAESAAVRSLLRRIFDEQGVVRSTASKRAAGQRTKYEQYYDYGEPVATIPSHRFLAIRRGEREEMLRVAITVDAARALPLVLDLSRLRRGSPFAPQLEQAAADALERLLLPSIENDVMAELKQRSDRAAIDIFADNLRAVLVAPPLGEKPVLAIDPGQRTGCKIALIDATGKFVGNATLYLSGSDEARQRAGRELIELVRGLRPAAIAVGNGTAGRETEDFVRAQLGRAGLGDVIVVLVNESGASVYSASDLAREEYPDLDVTVRGAISIGHRLQDPLAELCKIDPKSIGVGQYQHDVDQGLLARKLDDVVESCVNAVGVELNTASAPLLARVAGIGPKLAARIVEQRQERGLFRSRQQLRQVGGIGPKTFEQAAGFLRIRGGEHPLDASAVHPERYRLVERMARDLGLTLAELVGNAEVAQSIDLQRYLGGDVGEPTLRDIVDELQKPGRDPRRSFEAPRYRDDVRSLEDLRTGMALEGVVTNVTAFGAFVDIGVHQDGLVHVSKLADRFVKDPREVV
ncbi:MAG: RNA-binding transcriptional accessory protein, partial [Deltaproteobacteria bacterium]|nr:RNA-binding transcriptional accessory protein [Deltaproteobacteria bacterium]